MTDHAAVSPLTRTSQPELEALLASAASAATVLRDSEGAERACWLEAVASALDGCRDELVSLAAEQTHLPEPTLAGEIDRTTFQLRHFATVATSPTLLDLVVEPADPDYPVGPRPDLVRASVPIGPVLVFTASNFPFAFSVAGNDTASALAAGCPVVVKANPGHLNLSTRTAQVVSEALHRADAPDGIFGHILGVHEGVTALKDPRVKACGFTGSVTGGRELFDIAVGRPDPIPFYGELGSLNPVFVTPAAATTRPAAIGEGFVDSLTFRHGQLCTKPGVLFIPAGSAIVESAAARLVGAGPVELLTERINSAFVSATDRLATTDGAHRLCGNGSTSPTLVQVPGAAVLDGSLELEEIFGPIGVIVEYESADQLEDLATRIGPSLTATLHAEESDDVAVRLLPRLTDLVGRVVWNGWPTGVCVTRAMQHGGPYPATTSPTSTSIGADAVRRWLRPITFQNVPHKVLPSQIRTALKARQ